MEIVLTLVLGGLTGWLATILVKTDVAMGILTSVAVGALGSVLGAALAVRSPCMPSRRRIGSSSASPPSSAPPGWWA